MRDDRKLRPWELALVLALCVTLLVGACAPGPQALEPRVAGWWCVMFPPLYPETAETMASADRGSAAKGEYEIRFRVLELWEALVEKCR